jgi:MFS family permease
MSSLSERRPDSWKWWICGLLLLASTINYMDRQTLANAAVRITRQFHLSQEQYGQLEWVFGWAFAAGSLAFGFVVDRYSVRWVYPIVLLLWSGVGFATGLVDSFGGLLVCRTFLGLFEGGHWPCAIKATQRMLDPRDRSLGNSVLQSGTSIGAILTPQVMRLLLSEDPGSWRLAFQLVGLVGLVWIVAWFAMVRASDFAPAPRPPGGPRPILEVILSRRMLALLIIVALINTAWQTLRAWLPKFLQEGRGYTEVAALNFNSVFYIATDIGCLGAGAATAWLVRQAWSVHGSRCVAFLVCALASAGSVAVLFLPRGHLLELVLLGMGAGALGVFPIYHALTQDLSPEHQGKVTGIASIAAWAFSSPLQSLFGRLVDRTHSFDLGVAVVGGLPLVAFLALWLIWGGDGAGAERSTGTQGR